MKFNELGRSMVEMLGVLAIIGVLSVGAISGYSKAMMKYKINKFTEQIYQLLITSINTASLFTPPAPNPGGSSNYNLIPYYIKLGYIPNNMIRQNTSSQIYTNFGNTISFRYYNWNKYSYIEMALYLEPGNKNQCLAMFNMIKELKSELQRVNLYTTNVGDVGNVTGQFKYILAGDAFCGVEAYQCIKDKKIIDFERICQECENDYETCILHISYAYAE